MPQIQVHQQLHSAARLVTINHPNSFHAVCFKRIFTTPTGDNSLAGIAVLGAEDTPDYDFQELGMAKVLFVDSWQASNAILDGINANDSRVKLTALIEPDIEGAFELSKNDIFYLHVNDSMALCYEIIAIELPVGLPSTLNAKRYILNKRDDLDFIEALPKSGGNDGAI